MSPSASFIIGLCVAAIFALLYDIRDRLGESPKVAPPVEREPIPMLHWLILFAVGGVILGLIVWNAGSK
jgi:hypothetical protein